MRTRRSDRRPRAAAAADASDAEADSDSVSALCAATSVPSVSAASNSSHPHSQSQSHTHSSPSHSSSSAAPSLPSPSSQEPRSATLCSDSRAAATTSASTSALEGSGSTLSRRRPASSSSSHPARFVAGTGHVDGAAVGERVATTGEYIAEMENLSRKSQWLVLAVASGACAAFNGVFAKLTTTELTSTFAHTIAKLLGLPPDSTFIEAVIRAAFFILNLVFNGIMWTLFTKALARSTSTVQVTVINTSSNFMITALLGFLIFNENLPAQWFVGAALLVVGNVIIGTREEKEADEDVRIDGGAGAVAEDGMAGGSGSEAEGGLLTAFKDDEDEEDETEQALKRQLELEADDLLDLNTTREQESDILLTQRP